MLWFKNKERLSKINLEKQKIAEEQLQKEVSFRIKRLTILALYISKKNDFIKELKTELGELDQIESDSEIQTFIESNKNEIESKLNTNLFEKELNEYNNEFNQNIQKIFPDLTPKEKVLCSYLLLNLSSKEIAQVTNSSISAIEKSRYRLRKKLQIPQRSTIQQFLIQHT